MGPPLLACSSCSLILVGKDEKLLSHYKVFHTRVWFKHVPTFTLTQIMRPQDYRKSNFT